MVRPAHRRRESLLALHLNLQRRHRRHQRFTARGVSAHRPTPSAPLLVLDAGDAQHLLRASPGSAPSLRARLATGAADAVNVCSGSCVTSTLITASGLRDVQPAWPPHRSPPAPSTGGWRTAPAPGRDPAVSNSRCSASALNLCQQRLHQITAALRCCRTQACSPADSAAAICSRCRAARHR